VTDSWQRWFVPGVFPVTLLEIASERGHPPAAVLERAGIDLQPGEIFESGLGFEQYAALASVVEDALDDPRLGFEIGWRLPPTALGSLGFALVSAATMEEALELLQRFWHLVGRATNLVVDTRGDIGSVSIDLRLPMDAANATMVKEVTLVAMMRGILALAPGSGVEAEVWFDFPEPPQGAYVKERLGNVRYGMPASQVRFPTRLLQTKLAMSNPLGVRAAVAWCEREEKMRGLEEGRLGARVQSALQAGEGGYPSLEQIAKLLAMAPRTLRRHLKQEGTSYSSLLETARRRDALRLLDNPQLAAHEVAQMLGYVDAANFTRAFRRWTGQTPTQYRNRE